MNDLARTQFSQLPKWVQTTIKELAITDDVENWIQKPIPALDHRSIVQTISVPDGEMILRNYFGQVIGHFR